MVRAREQTGADWLRQLARRLRRMNVDIELGTPDAVALLRRQGAEGVTMPGENGATILFRDAMPTISVVLEEVAHALQAARRRFQDEDIQEMSCLREIEAKQCSIDRRERLGIPEDEDSVTRAQIALERDTLDRLRARWP